MTRPPLHILFAASEAAPYAKTGGLADVVGALPVALARLGHRITLVIPRYPSLDQSVYGFHPWATVDVPTFRGVFHTTIERASTSHSGVDVLAVRHDPYFWRSGLYQAQGQDYPDNLERFAFFCRAVLQVSLRLKELLGLEASLLHLHDWQTALCAAYLATDGTRSLSAAPLPTLFTIHNLGYQGLFPAAEFTQTGLPPSVFSPSGVEYYGQVNVMKAGLMYADFLSTVSPTYSEEIQTPEYGCGLEGVVAERRSRLVGIVNGIDDQAWDPRTDPHLVAHYDPGDLSGKVLCKRALQQECGLPVRDVPVLGIVSRFTWQKGLDLVLSILPELMELDLQVILLGSGDQSLEHDFIECMQRYPRTLSVRVGFDDGLAHRIEAGADMFVMPSRYEPCGLSQLYSLRYGTVPIVRRTGGLADTVVAYTPNTIKAEVATGFQFVEAAPESLLTTILLALEVQRSKTQWASLMQAGMKTDVSWTRSAQAYEELYTRMVDVRLE
jgi:starch synthase